MAVALATVAGLLSTSPAQAEFGIAELTTAASSRDGTLDFQAGSHPFDYTVDLEMSQDSSSEPEGTLRALRLDLPAGLVGNPLAVPACSRQDFEGSAAICPGNSQIGIVRLEIAGLGEIFTPLYNVVPPPGTVASFGFSANDLQGFEQAFLRTGGDYRLSVIVSPLPSSAVQAVSQTIWGVPADPAHDAERVCYQADGGRVEGCASTAPALPLLTLPGSCREPLETWAFAESVERPGTLAGRSALSLDAGGNPTALAACESLPFDPDVAVSFESAAADSPTGLSVDVHLPQLQDAKVLAEAALKRSVIDLPEGVAINPPVAAGLAGCSPVQVGLESRPGQVPGEFTPAPAACPDAAKLGTVELGTPLIDHPLTGGLYLATPYENPFAALFAAYVVVADQQSGVVLKLPVQLTANPATGRLTLRLEETPQLPFEDLELSFRGGPRAVLRTPPVCGIGRVTVHLTPWSTPEGWDVDLSRTQRTSIAAGGSGPCPTTGAEAPNAPEFSAGSLVPAGGRHSPFVLRVKRAAGSQRLGRIDATLPAGLSAKLAGVPTCGDAAIAAGTCPPASAVGAVDVAAGAGPLPLPLAGRVYLAGPYRGAPLSLEILTPAVAGPFDLGTVGVRVALYVDPHSARIHAVSDPLPTILRGIPLDLRALGVTLDRPDFVLNPSSCAPGSVVGEVTSALGQQAPLADRFQVADCAGLGFKPKLSMRLLGSTDRGAHPGLRATLLTRRGDANLHRVRVALPDTALLDSRHIRAVCARGQLVAHACPAASVVGHVRAWTPLLDRPLEGPVFLRTSAGRLPGLTARLQGRVDVDLMGSLSSAKGRLWVGFDSLPDVPLEKLVLTMSGGRKGMLVNTGGVCAGTRAAVRLRAQSGKSRELEPRVRADCGT